MPEPVTASALATWGPAALSFLGNALLGGGQASAAKQQAAQARRQAEEQAKVNYAQLGQDDRQFGQKSNLDRSQYLDQRATQAADLRRRMNLTPLADRASAMLAARAGAAPAAFQARDFTRGTTPGAGQATGGYADTLAAGRTAAAAYRPGAGGMANPELEAARARLTSMAGVPGEYQAQNPAVSRLETELAEQMELLANARKQSDRDKYQARITALRAQLAQLRG